MGIDRSTIDQLRHILRPLTTRVANTVARAVVQLADDDMKLQLLQLGVLAGETIDGAEHFQAYGFSSVPLAGAEAVVVFPNGDRSHPLVIATGDRGSRPTGGQPGDVVVYNAAGAKLTLKASGDIEVKPAPGHAVLVHDGGAAASLATKQDLSTLKSAISGAAVSAGDGGATLKTNIISALASWPAGTTVLKGE